VVAIKEIIEVNNNYNNDVMIIKLVEIVTTMIKIKSLK